jgi:hypothetical protein
VSGHSDAYKGHRQTKFMDRWAPNVTTECTPENLRWNIARARAAEAELDRLKAALAVVKEFMP